MADATKGHTEEAARQSVLQCCIAPRAEKRELNRGKYVQRERGGSEREGGGFCRVGNIEKCRQPNLLDIYNGQTGQLVTANLPTCNAAQAQPERVGSTRYPRYASPLSFLPPFLQLSVMRMWDYLRCLRQAATATAAANGIYQFRYGSERGRKDNKRKERAGRRGERAVR